VKSPAVAIEKRTEGTALPKLLAETELLGRAFYQRPAIQVARDLLGKVLVLGSAAGRIVEVEAYLGGQDPAAHACRGITRRTRVLFGPPGHAYVYLVYGMYECLNVVAEPAGSPGCVLIRALEPLAGLALMHRRRPNSRSLEELAAGPGKLTLAMGITRRHNGSDLTQGPLTLRRFHVEPHSSILTTPRIGIAQAKDLPLRFLIAGSRFASRPRRLC
jgi:DNA-3-methyladenine glycosylase